MNFTLKKEIIFHLFNKLGVFVPSNKFTKMIQNLLDKSYLVDQKLKFETENGSYENSIFGASTKIETGTVKIMVANLSEQVAEYVAIVQLDAFPPFVMRLSLDPEDGGSLVFWAQDTWIEAGTLYQAKLLVAMESMTEIISHWSPLSEYKEMYKTLIDFLKFENSEE